MGPQLSGCVPSGLQAHLNMTHSDLGGLPFCTEEGPEISPAAAETVAASANPLAPFRAPLRQARRAGCPHSVTRKCSSTTCASSTNDAAWVLMMASASSNRPPRPLKTPGRSLTAAVPQE